MIAVSVAQRQVARVHLNRMALRGVVPAFSLLRQGRRGRAATCGGSSVQRTRGEEEPLIFGATVVGSQDVDLTVQQGGGRVNLASGRPGAQLPHLSRVLGHLAVVYVLVKGVWVVFNDVHYCLPPLLVELLGVVHFLRQGAKETISVPSDVI